ncbi:hypothetical protein [Bradyrhizobium sp. 170]|uniref:hypothetical protein n=1 Tax=Bradyrhizobium sp. 170 TaxID=2782641 RepID=UPI001FFE9F28|nr:hypothetical protein [Bradyrhizobium sp. 170]UPK03148.1 hypothetical protein IVB05_37330 [Bradyrhizobium sp. 170]
MTEMNGLPYEAGNDMDETVRDIQRLAARNTESRQVQETLPPSALPFDQQKHDLMIKGIDQVATDWVSQLERSRENSKAVEQLVMERAAKVKSDITALYLLGSAVLAEAKRGDDVNERLASELDKLAEYQG